MPPRKKRKGGNGAIATAGTDDPETNTETRKGNQDTAAPIVIRIANPNTVGGGGGSTSLSATDLANAKRAVGCPSPSRRFGRFFTSQPFSDRVLMSVITHPEHKQRPTAMFKSLIAP